MIIGSGITIGSGISFLPENNLVTNGLILNLDAGNTSSYPGSGTTWADLSGTSHNFSFSAGAPSFTSAGNQSYFTFGNVAIGGSFLPATAYTKIAIFQTPGNYGNIISANGNQNHAFWGASTQTLQSGHNGAWSTIQAAVTTPLNRWVFGAVSFNTTTGWRLYLGTNTPVTNANTTPPNSDPADVEIGGFAGNANNMNGSVGVALIYNRVLSDSEITQIRTYYASRFTNLY
jgi:hypothetical protein